MWACRGGGAIPFPAGLKCFDEPTTFFSPLSKRAQVLRFGELFGRGDASRLAQCGFGKFSSARQLPARDVLDFLPKIRCQTRASFRSRAARACALLAALSLHLANDHQMTPPLFAGAFRAFGPCAPLTAARLSGTPSAALRPKASRGAGLRGGLLSVEKTPPD